MTGSDAPSTQPARVRVEGGVPPSRLDDLNAACRAIAGADSLENLLRTVAESAQGLIGTHQAVASRLVHGWGEATTHVSLSDKYAEWRSYDEPPQGLGVLNFVTRENLPLRLSAEELVEHPEWRGLRDAPGHPPLPDYLAAPLISRNGRNIGLIQLSDKVDGSKFTEDDEGLLVQVAQMASATLEHVEGLERERALRRELESRAAEARLIGQVGIATTSSDALPVKLQGCVEAVVEQLGAAFARIWLLDEPADELVLVASAGLYTHLDGGHARVPVGAYKIGRIAGDRHPHLTNDVPNDPEISDPDWAEREGMVAFAGYPLVLEQRCIGVLAMFARQPLPESSMAALAAVADAVALAVEQARDAQRLEQRAVQMRRLAEVASAVNAATDLDAVLDLITEEARSLIGAHQAITSVTQGGDWSQAITSVSLSEKYAAWRDYEEEPDGSGIYAFVCKTQQPARLTQAQLEAHPRWRGFGDAADRHSPMRGWLAAPLTAPDGTNFGLVQLSDKLAGDFDSEDEAVLVQLAGIASSAVHKTRLYEERVRVARILQQSLLPPALPDVPGVEVAARYQSGREDVGGDFYDLFPVRGRSWGVVIGDVRGKGPDAAALTALARHSTRTAAMLQRRPSRVLAVVNQALHDTSDPERFCSAAYLRITTGRSDVRVDAASGGHPPLLILRADGQIERMEPTGPLIGLFPDIELSDRHLRLEPGDSIIAYTDGITEARTGEELFGHDRLVELVGTLAGRSADDIAGAVSETAAAFAQESEADDAAVIVLRVAPDPMS
ncbi:MAG TPA: SpoIIE family protein phosphatase [Egibacteraceae bacterium]|nr:SpoIIE family protein phosphatase [Egibacteraceae bacterium]